MDQLDRCREILREIHGKRLPVAGGSGKRPRYEMRDTGLYFKLGTELLRIVEGRDEQNALATIARAISRLQKEFDDNTNVFHWSVRFVISFRNEDYFRQVSEICHFSFGQLREVVEILDVQNPLSISREDLDTFTNKMRSPITYEDVRRICMELKTKYLGQVPTVDTADVRDVFDDVEVQVIGLLEGHGSDLRQKWRQEAGLQAIEALRRVLMLLPREEVFESVKKTKPKVLGALSRDIHSSNPDIDALYHFLLDFLYSGRNARDHIRKAITPLEMGQLQTMMKALTTEENYASYTKTQDLFNDINI